MYKLTFISFIYKLNYIQGFKHMRDLKSLDGVLGLGTQTCWFLVEKFQTTELNFMLINFPVNIWSH